MKNENKAPEPERTLPDALADLDKLATEVLALIQEQPGRHSSIATDHSRLCTLENAVADLAVAIRNN
jgi:hypothetical protein